MDQIKYVLLDLDGTLTDPKQGIHACIHYAMNKLGLPLPENTDLDWTIGPPLKQSFEVLLDTVGRKSDAEQALIFYRERFADVGLFENYVYPQVKETLHILKNKGYVLYLATAKPQIYAQRILAHFELLEYFKYAYGSELNGDRTNKADLIAYILQSEKINANECVMVGDRRYDILGARHHHIDTIAVRYGYGTEQELDAAAPKYSVQSFNELMNIL
ncbi:HAD-IA family hydrolase [Acinetobacter pollinis]|uniref:HAD-IA family hydrolase n=1 Tax=Acinetobacter pollinis TaxID=2605270 RepID=UPI0018C276D5|nr:HAD-IA family hydrolase [Acinetobacter pollinis]MBF7693881.1 HAD-IA family hydrolase [Acinetobacter pollinis]MBF7701510.1 HAD-IA family hydrolase [Acinetobacter pollinis]